MLRILIVGAGAIGGYLGGRLLQGGHDVTFLVRERRAAELARDGLVIRSPLGDAMIPAPTTVGAGAPGGPYDLVLLACKAYDLDGAIDAFAPAIGPSTIVVPMLNGMRHLDVLDARFGAARVAGGLCALPVTLDERHQVVHLQAVQMAAVGMRGPTQPDALVAFERGLAAAGLATALRPDIETAMWEKWVFLGTLAAAPCLMRGSIGQIVAAPGGVGVMRALLDESCAIAAACGVDLRQGPAHERTTAQLFAAGSPVTASMFRDLKGGHRTEAEHVLGDLLARGERLGVAAPMLAAAYAHLMVYENGREHA
jgi:2-dehydropantoate 2-reductase